MRPLKRKYKIAISLLNAISKTWKFESERSEIQTPAIVAFWHGEMLPVWKFFSAYEPTAIVSQSKDGEILSRLLKKWNYKLIRGSSSQGGSDALSQLTESAKENLTLITPDGPRGPLHKFKPGAIVAAKRSGSPVYLCETKISGYKEFGKSWDNFKLPLPFAKIKINISKPIFVDSKANEKEISNIIKKSEEALNAQTNY